MLRRPATPPPAVANFKARGGQIAPPPLEGFPQNRISFPHLFPIFGRICGIRQDGDDVGDNKPPLIVMHRAADFALLKQCHLGGRLIVWFIYNKSSVRRHTHRRLSAFGCLNRMIFPFGWICSAPIHSDSSALRRGIPGRC